MGLRYTEEHEWLRQEADGSITVGITDYAKDSLGDLVAVLESVKAASNITMPLDGEVLAVNEALNDAPETINSDPLNAGWFFRFQPANAEAFAALLDEAAYQQLIKG